ncbi:hypothetical protein OnM2_048012 [Erysiphe neolycopersici]|uniref:Uncharacterized protein n=1 Tax=Erysiphe neolycopersici TaxID=212602 RepID=A0A420HTB3_9PEZI|nr:hypothetical protein OnM2_048012 [Erysiphe neolycopersici]
MQLQDNSGSQSSDSNSQNASSVQASFIQPIFTPQQFQSFINTFMSSLNIQQPTDTFQPTAQDSLFFIPCVRTRII